MVSGTTIQKVKRSGSNLRKRGLRTTEKRQTLKMKVKRKLAAKKKLNRREQKVANAMNRGVMIQERIEAGRMKKKIK